MTILFLPLPLRNTWKTRNTGMKKTWPRNWKVSKVSRSSPPLSSFGICKHVVFFFLWGRAPFPGFCLNLSICLFVGSLHTNPQFFCIFFCFSSVGETDSLWFLRDLQGQVLGGLGGMCWGVPLLVVIIFRTLAGKLAAPGNRQKHCK